jgi:hypothetical protein
MSSESFEMEVPESITPPQFFDSFDGTHLPGLPELGGKFGLPAGTKLYKPNGEVEILDVAREVTLGAIDIDLHRARVLGAKKITLEDARKLSPMQYVEDRRTVVDNGKVTGTITGDTIYEFDQFPE